MAGQGREVIGRGGRQGSSLRGQGEQAHQTVIQQANKQREQTLAL